MTYIVSRIYTGTSNRSAKELGDISAQELAPQLIQGGGLLRYITLEGNGGRLGSFSAYQDQAAAQRGMKIAAEWASSTGAMADYKLSQTYEGELILVIAGQAQLQPGAAGFIRIYETSASEQEVRKAFEEVTQSIQAVPGLIRVNIVRLTTGDIAAFSSCDTAEHAAQLTEAARQSRSSGGLQKVLPKDPETIEVTLLNIVNP